MGSKPSKSYAPEDKLICKQAAKECYSKIEPRLKQTSNAFDEPIVGDLPHDPNAAVPNRQYVFFKRFMADEDLVVEYLLDQRFENDEDGEEAIKLGLKAIYLFLEKKYPSPHDEANLEENWEHIFKPSLTRFLKEEQDDSLDQLMQTAIIAPVFRKLDVVTGDQLIDHHHPEDVQAGSPPAQGIINLGEAPNPGRLGLYERTGLSDGTTQRRILQIPGRPGEPNQQPSYLASR